MDNLSSLLKKLRGNRTLREVAEIAGISHTYLGQLESGIDKRTGKEIKPSTTVLKSLSKAYNYPYEKLLQAADYLEDQEINLDDIPYEGRLFFRKLKNLSPESQKKFLKHFISLSELIEEEERNEDN